jgi:hypothetical protein
MKRIQIDLPDYIVQMIKELNYSLDWKEREIIIRAIEQMYKDFCAVGKDPLRIFHVYRKDKDLAISFSNAVSSGIPFDPSS